MTKHLKVLHRAGLISQSRAAQKRPCRLEAAPLKSASDWIEQYRNFWEHSLDRLEDYLRELQAGEKRDDTTRMTVSGKRSRHVYLAFHLRRINRDVDLWESRPFWRCSSVAGDWIHRDAARHVPVRAQRRVAAPADIVYSIINDLSRWGEWSPYDARDPQMKKTYAGPSAGPGASYAWNGNNQVGEGRLTIVESRPGELVAMKLEFSRPFKANNQVKFKLVPAAGGTHVSWIMNGTNNFISKAMSLIMDMDKMVGKDFEQGLANLDAVARAETARLGLAVSAGS